MQTRSTFAMLVCGLLACQCAPAPAPVPTPATTAASTQPDASVVKSQDSSSKSATRREDVVTVHGTVESITLHNINKARGHYTFNVEVALRHTGVERAGSFEPGSVANPLIVRVDKVYWGTMTAAQRDKVAPHGPAQTLSPTEWGDMQVGRVVDIDVTFTSPSLAHRVP